MDMGSGLMFCRRKADTGHGPLGVGGRIVIDKSSGELNDTTLDGAVASSTSNTTSRLIELSISGAMARLEASSSFAERRTLLKGR
jgi:hypothetical protein